MHNKVGFHYNGKWPIITVRCRLCCLTSDIGKFISKADETTTKYSLQQPTYFATYYLPKAFQFIRVRGGYYHLLYISFQTHFFLFKPVIEKTAI